MTMIAYIILYPFLWAALLLTGLALSRMRGSSYKTQIIMASIPLSVMGIIIQFNNQAYLLGILSPLCLTICFWLIFKFRPFHAFLISLCVFASGVLCEFVINNIIAGFHFQQALFYQQNDLLITCISIALYHYGLYFLLHKLRLGFTFISPSAENALKKRQFSRTWVILALGLSFFLGMFNISVYFTNDLLIPITIAFTVCWIIVLFLSYRKELEE
jgi:hypothetical protein